MPNLPNDTAVPRTLLGHPPGLFTLFFAEMWERFSYYGMRALLILYMIKGFLSYSDGKAYAIYGAYTGLVYATPFIGGMLADRLLGQRNAVVLGGLLMAAGHAVMAIEREGAFLTALALLILGNGFFKPNISTMVGSLYPRISPRKDGGFTIFYMGINLGAALSPILCGYVAEAYGWHFGFGLATFGMLLGVAIFAAPTKVTQGLVLIGALTTAVFTFLFQDSGWGWNWQFLTRTFLCITLLVSGCVAFLALNRGGIPDSVGAPPSRERLRAPSHPWLRENAVIWVLASLGFAVAGYLLASRSEGSAGWEKFAAAAGFLVAAALPYLSARGAVYVGTAALIPIITVVMKQGELADWILRIFGILAFASLLIESYRSNKVERERMYVVLILTFFSMLFWAFFEQAGSSINNFTDRNVDRANEVRTIATEDVGTTVTFRVDPKPSNEALKRLPILKDLPLLSQEQLGYPHGGDTFNMTELSNLREAVKENSESAQQTVEWPIEQGHVGMGIAEAETPTPEFQAANAIFILIFGLVFSAIWTFLGQRGAEPSTPLKFSLGLLQLGLGFIVMWYGALIADERGMVGLTWLLLGYLLHTTGELCLSPVGLSMVTKLAPARIVSTVMGAWFLATAFSNNLAGLIAKVTAVKDSGDGEQVIPPPSETLHLFGDLFRAIGIIAIVASLICFALVPLLKKWMHLGVEEEVVDEIAAPVEQRG